MGVCYNTSFTCGYIGYVLSYGHASPSQMADIQERWYADISRFRELHGEPRVFRFDNASVNVSSQATSFRVAKGIRTETICPSESHQNGTAECMNRTLVTGARTVLLASGLERRWWHHTVMYQLLPCRRWITQLTFTLWVRCKETLSSPTPRLLWVVIVRLVQHLCLKHCTTRTPKIFVECI